MTTENFPLKQAQPQERKKYDLPLPHKKNLCGTIYSHIPHKIYLICLLIKFNLFQKIYVNNL